MPTRLERPPSPRSPIAARKARIAVTRGVAGAGSLLPARSNAQAFPHRSARRPPLCLRPLRRGPWRWWQRASRLHRSIRLYRLHASEPSLMSAFRQPSACWRRDGTLLDALPLRRQSPVNEDLETRHEPSEHPDRLGLRRRGRSRRKLLVCPPRFAAGDAGCSRAGGTGPGPSARFSITATRWACPTPRRCRRKTRWAWITSPSSPTRPTIPARSRSVSTRCSGAG